MCPDLVRHLYLESDACSFALKVGYFIGDCGARACFSAFRKTNLSRLSYAFLIESAQRVSTAVVIHGTELSVLIYEMLSCGFSC